MPRRLDGGPERRIEVDAQTHRCQIQHLRTKRCRMHGSPSQSDIIQYLSSSLEISASDTPWGGHGREGFGDLKVDPVRSSVISAFVRRGYLKSFKGGSFGCGKRGGEGGEGGNGTYVMPMPEKTRWWPREAHRGRRPDTSMPDSASTHKAVQNALVAVAI